MKHFVIYTPPTLADDVGMGVPSETYLPHNIPYSTFIHDVFMKGCDVALTHGMVDHDNVMLIIVDKSN